MTFAVFKFGPESQNVTSSETANYFRLFVDLAGGLKPLALRLAIAIYNRVRICAR